MLTVLVDYDSGNLHSAEKAFRRMAAEVNGGDVLVSNRAEDVTRADRIVLPGDGAFPACWHALMTKAGLFDAISDAVIVRGRPFLGVCVGMQMMATRGLEHGETPGFGWTPGTVERIEPGETKLKVPHMGWNDLVLDQPHPLLAGIATGSHAYFVHSYHLRVEDRTDLIAHVDYGGTVTAIVGRGNMVGTQFHPEKSQATGLRLIGNFLRWAP